MKKSLIALAVAGAMTAPMLAQADATVYGTAQARLIDKDGDDLDMKMAKTRLGVKGTVDNDIEGLTTGFQFEWEFDANDEDGVDNGIDTTINDEVSVRKSLVYMKGDFGQVTFGRQNSVSEVMDLSFAGENGGEFNMNGDRVGNGISYATGSINGFEAAVGIVMDVNSNDADEDVDAIQLGLTYAANGLTVALGYSDVETSATTTNNYDLTGLKVVYAMNDFSVGAAWQEKDFDGAATNVDTEVVTLGGDYTFGMTRAYIEYQDKDVEGSGTDNDMTVIGVNYKLGASASVGVEYADFDSANSDELVLEYTLSF